MSTKFSQFASGNSPDDADYLVGVEASEADNARWPFMQVANYVLTKVDDGMVTHKINGISGIRIGDTGAPTEFFEILRRGAGAGAVISGEGGTSLTITRNQNSGSGGLIILARNNGTIDAPSDVVVTNAIGIIEFDGMGGGVLRRGAQIIARALGTFASGNGETQVEILASPSGSVTPGVVAAFRRSDGMSMFVAGQVVIDASMRFVQRVESEYTAANIAAIGHAVNTTGKLNGLLVWDSTNHRMMRSRGTTAGSLWDVIDGSATVTPV